MAEDFYKTLGVKKDAKETDIKKAYRRLARKWHPDLNPGNKDAEKRFKEISMAYDCLGNSEKRKLYDEFGEDALKAGFDAEKARQYKDWGSFQQARGWKGGGQDYGRYESYEDIFGDLFGSGDAASSRAIRTSRGRDVQYEMNIELVSALKGFETEIALQKMTACTKCHGAGMDPDTKMSVCTACGGSGRMNVAQGPMRFTRPCPQCNGHGQVGKPCPQCGGSGMVPGTERIRVTIPPGVKDGSKVRVAGKGESGLNGGHPGDLYLIIHITPHPFLRREVDTLYMDVPITVREAVAGGTITIPTVEGMLNLKVPPKSQSGQTLRLRGKGAPNPKNKTRGDLMVKLVVKVPQTDEKEVLEAVEKIERFYEGDVRRDLNL